ncbi:RNA polymerase II C-terminal domain phosphatase-like 1 isoform X2 [Andrographis paniculata]|uniref:RNA polymerase II C-terminal domain phosphatase-like 1 isoform X2 n=1 Tax=Andrographis paniculata TaxID=175694 RepID=UPI0021E98315|nr:RNA polymerase II C-terminal domain phosphatase-like 1 isoform X2 [Andrographis paniculata]
MYRKLVLVYDGERLLGEAELLRQNGGVWGEEIRVIRISHYSPPSERCPPLAVLHTINSAAGICFKLESAAKNAVDSPLSVLHANCLKDNKTAVAFIDGQDVHLVAMHSRKYEGQTPCFWGFNVSSALYNSCLVMLNLRCLGIVFDLDETLIVANTMRSFEDRIDSLQRKISFETDQQRINGMMAEVRRYQDDRSILKQYAEADQINDNGKIIKAESEVVLALSDNHPTIVRPLIRLPDRNIILTRINPQVRDTSVLVRLRPAWEDLRSYLTAKGRKRFEVFVCTMAERDYALEMWRLLDPDSNLISPRELFDRIVCVKSGLRKSLFNVFQDGNCHPKMALVIDDRLKVWEEQDQPRLHVVPAFMPYFAPQAEANNTIPVLCVARNVACNVRGGFFKEFDDGLMQRIAEVAYEDDIADLPFPPDVSNYLVSEEDPSISNGNKDLLGFDGMAGPEVERRLKEAMAASSTAASTPIMNLDPRIVSTLQYSAPSTSFTVHPPTAVQGPSMPFPSQHVPQVTATLLKAPTTHLGQAETSLQSSPAREEGEVPESELDPDTRRRLLILQHGQDIREHPPTDPPKFPTEPAAQVPVPRVHPRGWFPGEEDVNLRQLNRVAPSVEFSSGSLPIESHRPHHTPYLNKVETPIPPGRALESQRLPKKELPREDVLRINPPRPHFPSFSHDSPAPVLKDPDFESGQNDSYNETFAGALQDIALKCGARVEFKQALVSSVELQFSAEVFFAGEKVGEGMGRTRREAQHNAAESSLMYLADKYLSQLKQDSISIPGDGSRLSNQALSEESVPSTASTPTRIRDPRFDASKKPTNSIAALKELCKMEGRNVAFHTRPQISARGLKEEIYAEVEINGQILGKAIGSTWDDAKSQAAEKALLSLKNFPVQFPYKRQGSPRSMQDMSNKRLKPDFSRVLQRMPSGGRHPKNNESPVP